MLELLLDAIVECNIIQSTTKEMVECEISPFITEMMYREQMAEHLNLGFINPESAINLGIAKIDVCYRLIV